MQGREFRIEYGVRSTEYQHSMQEHNRMYILVTPTLECSAHSSIMRLGGMNGSFLHVAVASLWRRDGTRGTSRGPSPI